MEDAVFRHLKTLALVVVLLTLSACAGTSMQGYNGPALRPWPNGISKERTVH